MRHTHAGQATRPAATFRTLGLLAAVSSVSLGIAQASTGNISIGGSIPADIQFSVDPQAVMNASGLVSSAGLSESNLVLSGAHGMPLAYRTTNSLAWVAGDIGHAERDQWVKPYGMAEVGMGHNLGKVQVNLSAGHSITRGKLPYDGHLNHQGDHLLAEALVSFTDKLWGVFSAAYQWGEADLRRNYLNGATVDSSISTPETTTWGLRTHLEWEDAWNAGSVSLSPYTALEYLRSRTRAYTEVGGSSPIAFDTHVEHGTLIRLGVHAAMPISATTRLIGDIQGAHSFEAVTGDVYGTTAVPGRFVVRGGPITQDWFRIGAGAEMRLGSGTTSMMLKYALRGDVANTWLAVAYRQAF